MNPAIPRVIFGIPLPAHTFNPGSRGLFLAFHLPRVLLNPDPEGYLKPTDKHQYLLKSSCHLNHIKKSIPFSLFLRLRHICSTDHFFDQRSQELVNYLMKRGYSRPSVQRTITRVPAIPRHETLKQQEHTNSTADRTPFVITFNPALYKVSSVLKKHLNILQSSPNCKDTFPVPPVIAYRRPASLRDLLVHSTLHNNTPHAQQPVRVYKCNHPLCLTCPFLQEGQKNYMFTATNEQKRIIDHLSCKSKYLIYLIQCNKFKCHG